MAIIWCNGEWLDSEESSVSWSDRGLLHGLGLFETLLAIDGRAVMADAHLSRLCAGLDRLTWELPDHELQTVMAELLERNELTHGQARIRLAITGGSGPLNDLASGEDRKIWMSAAPLSEGKKTASLGLGLWRRNEHSPLVGLKCASYAENLMALDWARGEAYDEVLFLNTRGNLCEAATANLFLVMGGKLYTPGLDSGCLPGVTREWVIAQAQKEGLALSEDTLQLDDLQQASECFLTSSTRGVVSVQAFEGREFGETPVASQLRSAWEGAITQR